jgi:hypothetical protein
LELVVNTIQHARILLVAEPAHGRFLLDKLHCLKLLKVKRVDDVEEARRLCEAGAADACLMVVRNFAADDLWLSQVEASAPGRDCGVPSLLLADVVTPDVMDAARRAGYVSAVPMTSTGRVLYRSIAAVLQKSRRTGAASPPRQHAKRSSPVWSGVFEPHGLASGLKPTLH